MKIYFYNKVGNLGNLIFSLTNLIYLCKKEGARFTTDLSQFWIKIPFIDIEKIPFFIREFDDSDTVIKSDFFRYEGVVIPREERIDIVKHYIKPYTKFFVKKIPETTCVINIRSGDIFDTGGTHKGYVQPPFAFYKKIIDEEKQYDKFLIITQPDLRNPTISLTAKYSEKVELQAPDVEGALSAILGASSIVSYHGTFLQVLFFSEYIKKVYCIDYTDFFSPYGTCPNAEIIRYKFLEPYIPVGEWINSQEQLSIMQNYPVEKIQKLN
jgi:hypothetical protein